MYYTKIGNRKILIEDLKFYSTCPRCGREVEEPDVIEMATTRGIDPICTNSYCRRCSERVRASGRALQLD